MAAADLGEQLDKYLTDAHAIEQQALAQMRVAPEIAGDEPIAAAFAEHLRETEQHEQLLAERLHARGAAPAVVKDLLGTLTGKGFTTFARAQTDTPGKLVAHAYSYEHMELAAYHLLERAAELAGDRDTAEVARTIAAQEQRMGERLEALFDRAVDASLRDLSPEQLQARLDAYLEDAHAIEQQALTLLARAPAHAGEDELARAYEQHRAETVEHERLVTERLHARTASPSRLKDAAMRLGALNWGAFFQLQPDTPAKLAAFAFAFEHLEIAAYELLRRVAARAGDGATELLAERILREERSAAARLHDLLDEALAASLRDVSVAA